MQQTIASRLRTLFDIVWYLGLGTLGLFSALLVFSLFVDTANLSSFSMVIQPAGLNVGEPIAPGQNVSMVLPVALNFQSHLPRGREDVLGSQEGRIEKVRANLRLPVTGRRFLSLSLAILLALMTLGLWVLAQLRQVFRAVANGRPFEAGNVPRIRKVGLGIILGELARTAAVFFWSYSYGASFAGGITGFVPLVDLNINVILCGLVVLAIAEVFREGSRLREEQALTI